MAFDSPLGIGHWPELVSPHATTTPLDFKAKQWSKPAAIDNVSLAFVFYFVFPVTKVDKHNIRAIR